MAKVVDCYRAEAGGSSTMYYYEYPDNTSDATRIYTGETFYLAADYGSSMQDSYYRMVDPEGWIPWYYVDNVQPVYRTVTDRCTPPDKVTLQTESKLLTITGGSGGDLNEWTGFGVSHRDRAINSSVWSEWSGDEVTSGRSVLVTVPGSMVRQFRVRTLGKAGSAYYSAYTVCETLLNGNTAAGTPVIQLPVSGADTCAGTVVVQISCPAEPDGDAMILQRRLDGGAWVNAVNVPASGGVVYDCITPDEGGHTVSYRLQDANGACGGEDGISFTRSALVWQRSIQPGDIIANREISFVADIQEMLTYVNKLCAFYGRPTLELPGTAGLLADWPRQLRAMQNAVDACLTSTGRNEYGFEQPEGWPNALRINQLRAAIETT